jgi:putative ATP-dependent endonuclease of the OLD family
MEGVACGSGWGIASCKRCTADDLPARISIILSANPSAIQALKCLSRALHVADPTLPDLSQDRRVAVVPLGGSTLQHWVAGHFLSGLGRKEAHIYDSDVAEYGKSIDAVNARQNGSWGVQTLKHEIESYLHADAINDALGVVVEVADHLNVSGHAVPKAVSIALHALNPVGEPKRDGTVKKLLAEKAFPYMTAGRLAERDPTGEVKGWMVRLADMV